VDQLAVGASDYDAVVETLEAELSQTSGQLVSLRAAHAELEAKYGKLRERFMKLQRASLDDECYRFDALQLNEIQANAE